LDAFEIPMDESLVLAKTMALFYHTIASDFRNYVL